MTTDNEWIALARYVAGECPPDERETVRRWIAADETRARLASEMERIGRASLLERTAWDTQSAWERLTVRARQVGDDTASRVASFDASPVTPMVQRPRAGVTLLASRAGHRRLLALWAAAAGLVVLAAGAYWTRGRTGATPSNLASATQGTRVFSTRRAQVAEVRLGDGTIVSLAPESRLTVPASYGTTERHVGLEGEAYFTVVHDSLRPFEVRAAHGVVHDLGTTFAVRSYRDDSAMRVVVADGQVRVLAAGAPPTSGPVLGRGDLAQLGARGAPVVQHGVDVSRYLAWTTGNLVFYRAPLPDVLEQLGRWYDVRFVLEDSSLRTRRVTMTLPAMSADALVEAMSMALDLRANRQGDTIRLRAGALTPSGGRTP